MDFEVVTESFSKPGCEPYLEEMRGLIPQGIHFFGHGHSHINHDALSEDSSYASFKLCFDLMEAWGLHPKAYAYPGGKGYLQSTQNACARAGFICGRGATEDYSKVLICANNTPEPENWFLLPAIPVSDHEREQHINNHAEMTVVFENALNSNAWIIIMYHNIGLEGRYNYYPSEEFLKDITYIKEADFWSGNMDDVALYIKERNQFVLEHEMLKSENDTLVYDLCFRDNYDNDFYNQPLTITLSFNINEEKTFCSFDPPIGGTSIFLLKNNQLSLNIVPDEIKYKVKVF
jgi:hypothetical protein